MSTVKANDLTNVTGGIPTVKGQRLIPTAWVNFDGTGTMAIRDSENVSSITDDGTALYTVNFAIAMANANYSCPATCNYTGGGKGLNSTVSSLTTSSFQIKVVCDYAVSVADNSEVVAVILGGQA